MMSFKTSCMFDYLFLKNCVAFNGTQMKNIFTSMTTISASLLSLCISHIKCLISLLCPAPPTQDLVLSLPLVSPTVTLPLSSQFNKDQQ